MSRPGILPKLNFPGDFTLKRECPGPAELDDQGNEFEACPDSDHGHLYFHSWCVHCEREAPE